jgi:hypothetical protein
MADDAVGAATQEVAANALGVAGRGSGQKLSGGGSGKDRLQRGVFKKADLDTDGNYLTEVGWGVEVFPAGAEMGEAQMATAGEFEARGEDGRVEIDDRAELNLQAELHRRWREGFAFEDPAAAVGEGRSEGGKKAVALFVAEALDVERLHGKGPLGCDCC